MDTTHIIYIGAVFVLAGMVKGVTGMGLPTVAVGLLSLFIPPLEAASLMIVPSLLSNVWQLSSGAPVYPLWQRLRPMLVAIWIGTLACGAAFAAMGEALGGSGANLTLGAALAVYGAMGLLSVRFVVPAGYERWLSPVMGVLTGALSAASGVSTLPSVPYLQALGLSRDELVQAMGLAFTAATSALAISLAMHNALPASVAGVSLLAQFPAMAGMYIGQRLRKRMDAQIFRRCFFVTLIGLGVQLLFSGS
jgi:uncharacterized membrane protein YfcA